MESGIYEILGMKYYTHGFGLIFVLPFIVWFFISFFIMVQNLLLDRVFKLRRLFVSAFFTIIACVLVFGDVYQIGQQANNLYRGMSEIHVYKVAESESYVGGSSIDYWSKYGFKYVESESYKGKHKYFLEDGKPAFKKIEEYSSDYELKTFRTQVTERIKIHKYQMIDRKSNEVLGEASMLAIHSGWADMLFFNLTGFNFTPWIRGAVVDGHVFNASDVVKATLKPKI